MLLRRDVRWWFAVGGCRFRTRIARRWSRIAADGRQRRRWLVETGGRLIVIVFFFVVVMRCIVPSAQQIALFSWATASSIRAARRCGAHFVVVWWRLRRSLVLQGLTTDETKVATTSFLSVKLKISTLRMTGALGGWRVLLLGRSSNSSAKMMGMPLETKLRLSSRPSLPVRRRR